MKKRDTVLKTFAPPLPLKAMLQDLKPHDHICLIYESHNEWKRTVIPFIAIGLKNKEKCIYIGNAHTDKEVRKQLKKEGIDAKKAEASGQLAILDERETYIKKGSFDPDRMIKFLIRETNKALKEGYTAFRVTGEMTWNGHSGSKRLLEYESKLNRDFFLKYPCLGLCLYDRGKFDPEIIKGVILTHPYILIGNHIYRNLYYIPPEKYLRQNRNELEVDFFLENIEKGYKILESLKYREEEYRKLFEESIEGIVLADIDTGIIIDCNQALLKLVERERDEVIGKPQKILHPPEDDIGNVSRTFEEHRKDKRGQITETRVITKTGELKDVEITANLTNIKGRKVLQGMFRDITERKKMEDAHRENEEKYRTIFENSVMGIFRTTPEGRYLSINPAGAKMYGYASEKEMMTVITDMAHQIYVNPEDRKRLRELLEKSEIVEGFESEHYTRDGQKIWVSMNVRAVRDKQGTIQYHETTSQDITARKLAEARLRESEIRYRSIFENAIEGIFQATPEGQYIKVNPALARMYGYESPEELLQGITDIKTQCYVNPGDRDLFIEKMEREGIVENYESQRYRKDGNMFWVSINARDIRDEKDKTIYYEGTLIDITERKNAEAALQKSKDELMVIIEGSAIPQFVIDKNHTVILWNKAIEAYSGIKSGEILGTSNHWKAFYPEERPCLVDLVIEGASEHEIERFYNNRWSKSDLIDGAYAASYYFPHIRSGVWLLFTATAIKDSSGNIIGGIETLEDITSLKATEQSLRQAEKKYRSLFENAVEGIYQTTREGQFLMANPAFFSMLGYSSFEELKSSITDISHQLYVNPEDRTHILELIEKEGVAKGYETQFYKKDGTTIWVSINMRSVYDEKENTLYYAGNVEDITGRKQKEKEIKSLQAQFLQAQKMEAIGRLAGGIAHDFNNLLTIIIGSCQLALLCLNDKEKIKIRIEEIQKAADRAASLTGQLLAYSRRQFMDIKVIDINKLIKNLEAMLKRLLGEDIELVILLNEGAGETKGDQTQIEQVIINLAINARDAMPEGGKLTIETASTELDEEYARTHKGVRPGSYVMISVSDTGIGMTEEVMNHLFEPFFTTKGIGRGTGLGLSTVYGIVKQSKGNIWAYSELGIGTTFKIYLPRLEEKEETPKKRSINEKVPSGNETILLIEDDEGVRKMTTQMLRMMGYNVVEAANGEHAISICTGHKEPIYLILTDIVMPGISGPKVISMLREAHPEARVLYTSGYTDNVIVHHGMLENGINFIQKPFTVENLSKKIREVLDKKE